jgi:hypothetical protein
MCSNELRENQRLVVRLRSVAVDTALARHRTPVEIASTGLVERLPQHGGTDRDLGPLLVGEVLEPDGVLPHAAGFSNLTRRFRTRRRWAETQHRELAPGSSRPVRVRWIHTNLIASLSGYFDRDS